MSTIVMNSSMMPADGIYQRTSISQQTFVSFLVNAEKLVSSVGYPAVVDLIQRISGIELPINRDVTRITPDDIILVAKLKYRMYNPARKKDWVARDEDYEFFLVTYKTLDSHTLHVAIDDNACGLPCDPDLWVDGLRWFGDKQTKNQIIHHVLQYNGFPDILNEHINGCQLQFDSSEQLHRFVYNALQDASIETAEKIES